MDRDRLDFKSALSFLSGELKEIKTVVLNLQAGFVCLKQEQINLSFKMEGIQSNFVKVQDQLQKLVPPREPPVMFSNLPTPVTSPSPSPVPPQYPPVKDTRCSERLCLYCGDTNHFMASCPIRSHGELKPISTKKKESSLAPRRKNKNTNPYPSCRSLPLQEPKVCEDPDFEGPTVQRLLVPGPTVCEVPDIDEPMQIGALHATARLAHRRSKGLCFYCGEAGHFIGQCPIRPLKRFHSQQSRRNSTCSGLSICTITAETAPNSQCAAVVTNLAPSSPIPQTMDTSLLVSQETRLNDVNSVLGKTQSIIDSVPVYSDDSNAVAMARGKTEVLGNQTVPAIVLHDLSPVPDSALYTATKELLPETPEQFEEAAMRIIRQRIQENKVVEDKQAPQSSSEVLDKIVLEIKNEGNAYVKKAQYELALEKYNDCLQVKSDECSLYTNRALCYLKLGKLNEALQDCDQAIKLDPRCVKAFYRRALANKGLQNYDASIKDLNIVIQMDPHVPEARQVLEEVTLSLKTLIKASNDPTPREIESMTQKATATVGIHMNKERNIPVIKSDYVKPINYEDPSELSHFFENTFDPEVARQIILQRIQTNKLVDNSGTKGPSIRGTGKTKPKLDDGDSDWEDLPILSKATRKTRVREYSCW